MSLAISRDSRQGYNIRGVVKLMICTKVKRHKVRYLKGPSNHSHDLHGFVSCFLTLKGGGK